MALLSWFPDLIVSLPFSIQVKCQSLQKACPNSSIWIRCFSRLSKHSTFRLRELQQGDWQITRGDQQVGLKMTPRNLGRSPPPTFTSLGHILTLLPQTMALCYMVGFRYIYKSGVDFSGTQGLGLPTLPFTISLYPFTLQVRGLWLFLNTPSPRSSVSLFTLFLLVRRAQCSTSNYWNLHIFSRMLSLLLCL